MESGQSESGAAGLSRGSGPVFNSWEPARDDPLPNTSWAEELQDFRGVWTWTQPSHWSFDFLTIRFRHLFWAAPDFRQLCSGLSTEALCSSCFSLYCRLGASFAVEKSMCFLQEAKFEMQTKSFEGFFVLSIADHSRQSSLPLCWWSHVSKFNLTLNTKPEEWVIKACLRTISSPRKCKRGVVR